MIINLLNTTITFKYAFGFMNDLKCTLFSLNYNSKLKATLYIYIYIY